MCLFYAVGFCFCCVYKVKLRVNVEKVKSEEEWREVVDAGDLSVLTDTGRMHFCVDWYHLF